MKAHSKLSTEAINAMCAMSSSLNMAEVEQVLKKRPLVLFIGNRNCGKSSVLNELLGGSYLPVHETPCTSRMVKISHSIRENTIRVVDNAGVEVQPMVTFTRKVPMEYVVVCDGNREGLHAPFTSSSAIGLWSVNLISDAEFYFFVRGKAPFYDVWYNCNFTSCSRTIGTLSGKVG